MHPLDKFYLFIPALLRHNGYMTLNCPTQWFDRCFYYRMITTIMIVNMHKSWVFVHCRARTFCCQKYGRRKRHNLCITVALDTLLTWWKFQFYESQSCLYLSPCFLNHCNDFQQVNHRSYTENWRILRESKVIGQI